jgi:aromatic-L-amino-acid decarboxylase
MGTEVLCRVLDHTDLLADRIPAPLIAPSPSSVWATQLSAPPPDLPGDLSQLLDCLDSARDASAENTSPTNFAYIPSGGLFASAVAEFYARAVNRHGGVAAAAPGFAAAERSVLSWMAHQVCGLPPGTAGTLTTGASAATFAATVAARDARAGTDLGRATVYLSAHTHYSAAKAARLAGIRESNIRVVPTDADLRMDAVAAADLIDADSKAGLKPFLLVATAGTADTGAVDPLAGLAAMAHARGLWLHVDAAYGGFFRLTDRGRQRLDGLHLADSVTLDLHKSLFLPFGTGALVVRNGRDLAGAHCGTGHYLRDVTQAHSAPDPASLGIELSREARGLRVWLPLHLYGTHAFATTLEEKLDLAAQAFTTLRANPHLETPWSPPLSTVAFRLPATAPTPRAQRAADTRTAALHREIEATGRIRLSSTIIDERLTLRMCILSPRTRARHVREALRVIADAAKRFGDPPRRDVPLPLVEAE